MGWGYVPVLGTIGQLVQVGLHGLGLCTGVRNNVRLGTGWVTWVGATCFVLLK